MKPATPSARKGLRLHKGTAEKLVSRSLLTVEEAMKGASLDAGPRRR